MCLSPHFAVANLATYLEGPENVAPGDREADGYTGVLRVIWDVFRNPRNLQYSTRPEDVKKWKPWQFKQINDLLRSKCRFQAAD